MASMRCSSRRRSKSCNYSASPDEDDDTKFSTDVNNYKLGKLIGYGSSAVVHVGTYLPLDKVVAIKVFDLDSFERDHIDELRKEIQIMSLSRHPNLLRVYGSLVHEFKLYIVMPFLTGGSCLDIMRTAYPHGFDEPTIGEILSQGLEGLSYLHKNGLIHRDIKAGNLLVGESGVVQLADFGVSSSLMEGGERKGLRKTFAGTPCWMAPEVIEQSGYGFKADIWSFGITALELANGRAPFAKYPPMKILMLTLKRDPPTLDRSTTRHKFSKTFKDMIDFCLAKDPEKRPAPEKLLQHSFFKQAAKRNVSLVNTLLKRLPTITERKHEYKPPPLNKGSSENVLWDFDSSSANGPDELPRLNDNLDSVPSPSKNGINDSTQKPIDSFQAQSSLKKSRFVIDMNTQSSTRIYASQPVFPPTQSIIDFSQGSQKPNTINQVTQPSDLSSSKEITKQEPPNQIPIPQISSSEVQQSPPYELRKGRFCVNSNTQVLHSPQQDFQRERSTLSSNVNNIDINNTCEPVTHPIVKSLRNDAADTNSSKISSDHPLKSVINRNSSHEEVPPILSNNTLNSTVKARLNADNFSQQSFTNNHTWTVGAGTINRRGRFEVSKSSTPKNSPQPPLSKPIERTIIPQTSPNSDLLNPQEPSDLIDLSRRVFTSTSFLCEKIQTLTIENHELLSLVCGLVDYLHKLGMSDDNIRSSFPKSLQSLLDKVSSSLEPQPPKNSSR